MDRKSSGSNVNINHSRLPQPRPLSTATRRRPSWKSGCKSGLVSGPETRRRTLSGYVISWLVTHSKKWRAGGRGPRALRNVCRLAANLEPATLRAAVASGRLRAQAPEPVFVCALDFDTLLGA